MLIFASALAAIIPMVAYLIFIWWFDRYNREPFKLVLQNYLWGSIGAIIFAFLGGAIFSSILLRFVTSEAQLEYLGTVIIAPVVEEFTKGMFLLITVTNRKFDNMTDGIVYGGAIGLGFGMTENFLYFISYGTSVPNWIAIVIIRTLFSAVMHCVATATFGAFLGYAKFKNLSYKIFFPIIGITLAILIHFSWNFMVSYKSTAILGFMFMLITIIIFIAVFAASVMSERRIIFEELTGEADMGLIPKDHPEILSSKQRNMPGWIDEKIRKTYIKAATTLAFRKVQWKSSKGKSKLFYEYDINNYREFLQNLLSSNTPNGKV
ncbi:protease PrsW [bacterium BMS3Abin03]|nr:protease PrsW [bacterium BMS3Abin03]